MLELPLAKRKVHQLQMGIVLYLELIHYPDRKPVDPPPIIQLKISHQSDPGQNYLQSTSLSTGRKVLQLTFLFFRSLFLHVM
jgi:hypothetical protein